MVLFLMNYCRSPIVNFINYHQVVWKPKFGMLSFGTSKEAIWKSPLAGATLSQLFGVLQVGKSQQSNDSSIVSAAAYAQTKQNTQNI